MGMKYQKYYNQCYAASEEGLYMDDYIKSSQIKQLQYTWVLDYNS